MEFDPLLAKIAAIFRAHNISYVITGGYAVSVWGRARATFDVDIVVQLVERDIKPVYHAIQQLSKSGYLDEDAMTSAVRHRREFNYLYPELGIKVDFFVKDDAIAQQEFKRAIVFDVEKTPISFISPEDLILSKLRWHQKGESVRQLEDVASVIRRQKKLDWKYLKRWAVDQGTWEILQNLKKKH